MHSIFILSVTALYLCGTAIALPSNVTMRGGKTDPTLGDTDLLNSCPGAAGSPNVERADKCTLVSVRTDPLTVTLGGSKTVETTTTVDADIGVDIGGISLGGGFSSTTDNSKTVSHSQTHGRPIMTVGVTFHSQTGNIQVNYGDTVNGHFIWYTTNTVTQLTPANAEDAIQVHESACGTDVTDLNNHS
ncbi:hypothetical protein GGX14DRAFT_538151 [Mycena pura]|uniref:Polygalacturonase n=1 Tax=Mycena pura TaxID=153505 RepID=A0AAD6XVS2_9AGAR|nr:hypothetical protein GGX14DRAFT_538151 [Mycena pura]